MLVGIHSYLRMDDQVQWEQEHIHQVSSHEWTDRQQLSGVGQALSCFHPSKAIAVSLLEFDTVTLPCSGLWVPPLSGSWCLQGQTCSQSGAKKYQQILKQRDTTKSRKLEKVVQSHKSLFLKKQEMVKSKLRNNIN